MDTGLRSRAAHHTDRLSGTFACASVRLGALSAHGQSTQMPDASIALDALKALQIHADFAAEVTLNDIFAILNRMNDLGQLLFAQILGANPGIDIGLGQDVFRVARADAVNVTKRNIYALIRGNFYSNNTSHLLLNR